MDNNRTYYSQQAETQAQRRNTVIMLFALGIGVGLGATAGLLLAPNSGHKTREGLTNSFEAGVKTVQDNVEELRKA